MLYATARSKRQVWDEVIGNVVLGLRASKNLVTFLFHFEVIYGFTPKLHADHSPVNLNESCFLSEE